MPQRNQQDPTVVVVQWIMGGLVLLIAMILGYRVWVELDDGTFIFTPSVSETTSTPTVSDNISRSLEQKDVEPIFNDFIESWNDKNYRRQLTHISQDFKSVSYDRGSEQPYENLSYSEYEQLKERLVQDYEWIDVEITNPEYILGSNNIVFVTYYQHYNSPKYESWGTNELYFKQENGRVKIFKEVFYRDQKIVK